MPAPSGLQVVRSCLSYRMRSGAGRKSSPLDDIRPERWTPQLTEELLELLWVLEATVAMFPTLADPLGSVVGGETFGAEDLPNRPQPSVAPLPPKLMRRLNSSRPTSLEPHGKRELLT